MPDTDMESAGILPTTGDGNEFALTQQNSRRETCGTSAVSPPNNHRASLAMDKTPANFMKLPSELRLEILLTVLYQDGPVYFAGRPDKDGVGCIVGGEHHRNTLLSLRLVCRLFFFELQTVVRTFSENPTYYVEAAFLENSGILARCSSSIPGTTHVKTVSANIHPFTTETLYSTEETSWPRSGPHYFRNAWHGFLLDLFQPHRDHNTQKPRTAYQRITSAFSSGKIHGLSCDKLVLNVEIPIKSVGDIGPDVNSWHKRQKSIELRSYDLTWIPDVSRHRQPAGTDRAWPKQGRTGEPDLKGMAEDTADWIRQELEIFLTTKCSYAMRNTLFLYERVMESIEITVGGKSRYTLSVSPPRPIKLQDSQGHPIAGFKGMDFHAALSGYDKWHARVLERRKKLVAGADGEDIYLRPSTLVR